MKSKKIFIAVVVVVLLAVFFWPSVRKYNVVDVRNGNILLLDDDIEVCLIGVSATQEGQQWLQNNVRGRQVVLQSDSKFIFDPMALRSGDRVYAYVFLTTTNPYQHVNASLLKMGKSTLQEETFLNDSLNNFRQYARSGGGGGSAPEPTPVSPSPINYEEDGFDNLGEYEPIVPSERKYHGWCDCENDIPMLAEACDFKKPYVRNFAANLAGRGQEATRGQSRFCIEQVCEVFDYCFNNWHYVNDPKGMEYLATASESIHNGLNGDCDDFAVTIASCLLAVGGNVCIVSGQSERGGHAWAEVDINGFANSDPSYVESYIRERFSSKTVNSIHTRRDGNHLWLNLDWQASYPGGPYYSTNCSYYSCVNNHWSYSR